MRNSVMTAIMSAFSPAISPWIALRITSTSSAMRFIQKMIDDGPPQPDSPSIPPEQPHQLALDAYPIRRQDTHLIRRVGRLQRDRGAAAAEALQRRFLLVDQRDHDVAGVGAVDFLYHRDVAVQDAG